MERNIKYILVSTVIISVLLLYLSYLPYQQSLSSKSILLKEIGTVQRVQLTIIYDNNPYVEGLETAWGFSCHIIADGVNLLFDTGGDPRILLANMEELDINPQQIEIIVLSHIHSDHVGGIFRILEINSEVKVYVPATFPESFKDQIKAYRCELIEVKKPMKICRGIATTGELGTSIKEQSLVINTTKGMLIVTGCAHPGIVNIVSTAKELTEEEPYLVLGGFHLIGATKDEISSIIDELQNLGTVKVAPCHCTGDLARAMFKEAFKENYVEAGLGMDPPSKNS